MTHPISWLVAATDHGPMIVNRHDAVTTEAGATFGVGHQLLTTGTYDAEDLELQKNVLDLLRHYRAPNGEREIVYLDGGANIGAFTIPIARHMRGWGRVVAVEPQDQVFYALCGNVVLNNLGNVYCVHAAIDSDIGVVRFPKPDYGRPASYGSIGLENERLNDSGQVIDANVVVNTTTVDELARLGRIDLVKLDLEGHEMAGLHGAAEMLQFDHPVLCVEHLKSGWPLIKEFLEPLGYVCFVDTKDVWAAHRDDPMLKHFTMKNAESKA